MRKNSNKITTFNKFHVPSIIKGKLFCELLRKKRLKNYYMPLIARHILISELFKLGGKKTRVLGSMKDAICSKRNSPPDETDRQLIMVLKEMYHLGGNIKLHPILINAEICDCSIPVQT